MKVLYFIALGLSFKGDVMENRFLPRTKFFQVVQLLQLSFSGWDMLPVHAAAYVIGVVILYIYRGLTAAPLSNFWLFEPLLPIVATWIWCSSTVIYYERANLWLDNRSSRDREWVRAVNRQQLEGLFVLVCLLYPASIWRLGVWFPNDEAMTILVRYRFWSLALLAVWYVGSIIYEEWPVRYSRHRFT